MRRALVPGLLGSFVGWTQLLIRTSRGLNTEANATHPCTYNNGFLASSEIFLAARENMVFEYFSGGKNHRMGIRRREVFSAGSYTPREFGFTCYERPWPRRNSPPAAVQRRQHGVPAQCLQTNHQRGG